jgi:hypothetical protein
MIPSIWCTRISNCSGTCRSNLCPQGLVKLYGYRMGTFSLDNELLEATYRKAMQGNRSQQELMTNFAKGCIAYNLRTLYQLLSNTLISDLQRAFGDDQCLSSELVHALNMFAKIQTRQPANSNTRMQLQDSMGALVETCHYNAYFPRGSVSSSEAIIRTIEALDTVVQDGAPSHEVSHRTRLVNALKIVFYIGVRYYHLNLLRFSDEIIKRSYDRTLKITDLTLAAIPFDPTLVYTCSDETSNISRWGIEYIQSLEAVLLYAGGVRYTATLAVEANGNKGVDNV